MDIMIDFTNAIEEFIDEIECMSKTRKELYKKVIMQRYEIIKNVHTKLKK